MRRVSLHLIMIAMVLCGNVCAQTPSAQIVIRHTESNQSLAQRWDWALHEAGEKRLSDGYWIGYSIDRLMQENSFIGTFYSDQKRNRPSLLEVISGVVQDSSPSYHHDGGNFIMTDGMMTLDDEESHRKKIIKEVGILFHGSNAQHNVFDAVKVTNLSLHVDLENDPLIWIGGTDEQQSITLLTSLFRDATPDEEKESIVRAIGLHQTPDVVFPILRDIVNGKDHTPIREEAVFWVGQTTAEPALPFLIQTAESDRSEDVREKAIFAISEIDNTKATEALISLAQEHRDVEMRKKAMFWLGQKASEKAVSTLEKIAADDDDSQVQKSAVFALTQLPDNGGVVPLIKIAKTHTNPRVRKEAIFWLGQCEDQRALDALVEMIRK